MGRRGAMACHGVDSPAAPPLLDDANAGSRAQQMLCKARALKPGTGSEATSVSRSTAITYLQLAAGGVHWP